MKRYLITFSYDGTNYNGYQRQPQKNTIQGEIEKALTKINNNQKIKIHASGRTDGKVHALNQKAHFDMDINISLFKFKNAINSNLNKDIYIKTVEIVDNDFHARYNVKCKEYIYKLNIGEYNPLDRNYIYQYNRNLDIEKIKIGLKMFEGEHNFTAFACQEDIKENCVRKIIKTKLTLKNDVITFTFLGTGFLKYQVRNMIGTLIEVGENKKQPEDIKNIIESKNRNKAGQTAPPEGLYLNKVIY
ncbi:MAG: tRNA pseudouridine(38-40) synthase TruA [Bacilli bacterium]|nr:tRNA pseudouridine(38-40) synthase TruA [Bacilli bacterium]